MKLFKKVAVALACSFAFSSAANAGIIPFELPAAQTNVQLNFNDQAKRSTILTFDFNALLTKNFAKPSDIVSAILNIYLTDRNGGDEKYTISVGGQVVQSVGSGNGNNKNNHVNTGNANSNAEKHEAITFAAALADFKEDGKIDAVISATAGEFYFAHATLNADVNVPEKETDVPEPASLALLGMGLLGLVGARRRA